MRRKRAKKTGQKLQKILGLSNSRYTGKLIAAKHTSYGALFIIMLLLIPRVGLTKGLLGAQTKSGNVTVTARVEGPAPTSIPVIIQPRAGTINHQLVTVSGTCEPGLLVKVFSNNAFIGSVYCDINSRFSLQATLFIGKNVLKAAHYDNLDQAGPDSQAVVVDVVLPRTPAPGTVGQIGRTGNLVGYPIIKIDYSYRQVDPNQDSTWAAQIIYGAPPYQLTINWGDNDKTNQAVNNSDSFNITHQYQSPGNYIIKLFVKDSAGNSSFLQIGITVNGTPASNIPAAGANISCNDNSFWSFLGSLTCQNSPIYKLIPLYWALLTIVGILYINQLLNKDRGRPKRRPHHA